MITSSFIAALALVLNVMPIQPFIQDDTQEPEAKSLGQEAPPEFAPSLQLSLEQRADVKCAVAFAIVAGRQERGEASALAYPLLGDRGRTFFADLGQRLIKDLDATPQQVQLVLENEARGLQENAQETNDPNGTVDAIMEPCLSRLDAVIPLPPEPSLPECAAITQLAYDEVFAREGLSPTARDLKTLASVLESRARDELRAQGKSGNEIDAELAATKAVFAAEALALEVEGKSPKLDYDYCFELAKP